MKLSKTDWIVRVAFMDLNREEIPTESTSCEIFSKFIFHCTLIGMFLLFIVVILSFLVVAWNEICAHWAKVLFAILVPATSLVGLFYSVRNSIPWLSDLKNKICWKVEIE